MRGVPTCAANTPRGTSSPCWEERASCHRFGGAIFVYFIQDPVVLSNGITKKEVSFLQCDAGIVLKPLIGHDLMEGQHTRVAEPVSTLP